MSGSGDSFGEDTAALENVQQIESTDYICEYTGSLADTGERVRIMTLAPELADVNAAVDAFTQVSDQWYNASANANIRPIRERGTNPQPWIALPDDSAETLAAVQASLSPDATEVVIGETAEALRTLGLYNTVHGHLSPTEIYLTATAAETVTVQVGGFGLENAVRAAVGERELTPYTAPELVTESGQPTEQTDVYGLGAVTYFVLTGQTPVAGADLEMAIRDGPTDPPSVKAEEIPAEVDDVVMQALAVSPADRHNSPYTFYRAFVSVFDLADFAGDEETDGESEAGPEQEILAASGEGSIDDETAAAEAAPDEGDGSSVTRRAALGVLGLGVAGGAGALLLRTDSSSPAPDDQPTEQSITDTEQVSSSTTVEFNDSAVFDDLENTHPELELTQQVAYEGQSSASIRTDDVGTVAQLEPFDRNRQIGRFTYYWQEDSGSFGGGIALETENGNLEVFAGTNNPEWTVINGFDDDRQTVYAGDGYDRWIRTELTFDWNAGTVTTAFTDLQTERSESVTVNLASGLGVGRIRLVGFTSRRYPDRGFYTGRCYMQWDNIQIFS